MRRAIIVAITLALVTVPAASVAHQSTGTDTDLVLENVWDVFGPGCNVDNGQVCAVDQQAEDATLGALELQADRMGGILTDSTVHGDDPDTAEDESAGHGRATHVMTGYQCNGIDPSTGEAFDATLWTEFPYYHSDLENGIFEATGSFFVPFEVIGPDADRVTELHFGYLHTFPWPASSGLCSGAFPVTGAYYEFYRGDYDGSDGWEIPINTLLVPDMAYGAILRGLDAQGNTVVSGFVYANVNNYLNELNWRPGGTPQDCADETGTGSVGCQYHDVTPPYPTVKNARPTNVSVPIHEAGPEYTEDPDGPGGETAFCPNGVVFSFGEPLSEVTFDETILNERGMDDAAPRDVDALLLTTIDSQGWGPEYCVDETELDDDFTIHVKAVDLQGNVAHRTVTTAPPS